MMPYSVIKCLISGDRTLGCVNALSSSFGAEVIVDGLAGLADGKSVRTLFAEPYFADGPFAQAVAAAVASGVSYIAAAGDFADRHYEADFEPFLVPTPTRTIEFHDFGLTAGGASDATMDLQLAGSGTLEVSLQWNDLFGASRNNYDLILANDHEFILKTGLSGEKREAWASPEASV